MSCEREGASRRAGEQRRGEPRLRLSRPPLVSNLARAPLGGLTLTRVACQRTPRVKQHRRWPWHDWILVSAQRLR